MIDRKVTGLGFSMCACCLDGQQESTLLRDVAKRAPSRALAAIALAIFCAALTGVSWAQDQAPAGATPADQATSSGADQLQEVVVTAERRTVDIQTTPISMQAISGDTLAAQHLDVINDLQSVVPSMVIYRSSLNVDLNIRGLGNGSGGINVVDGVGLFFDGLYEPSALGLVDEFFDLADTQVLKGPQGTFAGFATTGGELDVNSANPNFMGLNGFVEGQYGNYTDQKIDGALNIPVTDTLALRLAFLEETRGSFYRDEGTAAIPTQISTVPVTDPGAVDAHGMRTSALWKPTDNFQALFKVEYDQSSMGGFYGGQPNQATFTLPAGAPNVCPTGLPGPVCHSAYYPYSTHEPFVLDYIGTSPDNGYWSNWNDTLELRYTLPGGVVLRSFSGFYDNNLLYVEPTSASSDNVGFGFTETPNEEHYQQEFDLISPTTGRLQWVAGMAYFYRSADEDGTSVSYIPPGSVATPQYSETMLHLDFRSEGLFGNVTYQLTPSLQVYIGARESGDNNAQDIPYPGYDQVLVPGEAGKAGYSPCLIRPGSLPLAPGYGCKNVFSNGKYQDRVPTGKGGVNWTPLPGQFLYAFYARGYQPGGYEGATDFKAAIVNDYELGWKSTDFDRHLQSDVDLFWINYQDMQEQAINPAIGATEALNLGPTTIRGIELNVTGRAGGLSTDLSASFIRSKLGNFTAIESYALAPGATSYGQCGLPQWTPPTCTNYAPYEVNLTGEQVPNSPEFQGNLSVQYAFTIGNALLTPRLQFSYVGRQFANIFENSDYYLLDARHLLNAYLTYQTGPLSVQLFATNLTNQLYLSGNSGAAVYYGDPLQFGLKLRRDF